MVFDDFELDVRFFGMWKCWEFLVIILMIECGILILINRVCKVRIVLVRLKMKLFCLL